MRPIVKQSKCTMNGTDNRYSKDINPPHSTSIWDTQDNITRFTGVGNTSLAGNGNAELGHSYGAIRLPPLLKVPVPMVVILSLAYLIVFLLAVVNNSLVVSVIYRNQQMRNATNFFLANLAVADITVSFLVLPITLLSNIFTGKILSLKCFSYDTITIYYLSYNSAIISWTSKSYARDQAI